MLQIIDIKVTEIKTGTEFFPQFRINFFFHEGGQCFFNHFGIGRFVPFRTSDTDDAGVRVNVTRFL
ncbi:hypothetical protein D3C80_1596610 [compost metagenome]